MNPQQKEFDTALSGLTTEQRASYMQANPIVGVGGVQQSVNNGTYQPIPKTITTGDLNSNQNLIQVAPKAPTPSYNPIVPTPTGTTIGADGTATPTPPAPAPVTATPEKNTYQKILESIGVDIGQLEKKPEVTKQLQQQQQLAQKTEQATRDYNTYNLKKRELENKIREMEASNPDGQLAGARSVVIDDFRRKANSELADLAIQAQASQGLETAARQTIKDTLEAQFSPIEDRIARRTQYAQLASNDLTESEKFKLTKLNKKDEANQKEVSTFATKLANTVFENGAPVGVRTKIFNIAGDYATGKLTKEQAQTKMSEAAADYGVKKTTTSANSNQMTDNERALMTQFRGEQIVKDYNNILGEKGTIDAYIQNGVGGPSDLATIFTFMKGLDPTSVVRESEYNTAAASGNIFQGVWSKFNGYFKDKGGFLPDNVKQEFQNLVNQKLAVKQKQYDNVKKNYEDIAKRQGLDSRNVIIDYASGGSPDTTTTSQPVIDRGNVEINGLQVRLPSGEYWNAPTLEALNKFKIKYGL